MTKEVFKGVGEFTYPGLSIVNVNPGFERIVCGKGNERIINPVTEKDAETFLIGYSRDPQYTMKRLKGNPYGLVYCAGGTLRWNPDRPVKDGNS